VRAKQLAIVLKPNSGDLIQHLAHDREVWAVSCPTHSRVARTSGGRVTLFAREPHCREDLLLSVLRAINEPWSELEVIGAAPTYPVVRQLQEYAVARVEPGATGFCAYRA
jgi:hypothetical protein